MAWIESHQKLEKSGKLLELANKLRINKYQAIGHLHAFWWWALDNAEDGDVTRFSNAVVTQACGFHDHINEQWMDHDRPNDAIVPTQDDLVTALIVCGFIDKVGDRRVIHDWDFYTHRYYEMIEKSRRNRELSKQRVKKFRELRNSNAVVTQVKRYVTHPTRPNQTLPNHKKNREVRQPFTKPTTQEVTAYAKSIGFDLDGEHFVNHYEARGWKYGPGRPVESWKAAVVTWKKKQCEFGNNGRPVATPAPRLPPPPPPEKELSEEDRKAGIDAMQKIRESLGKGKRVVA